MKSISGNKDVDREILLKLSDMDLLKTCKINNYFKNEVCNDQFFINRLEKTYPDALKYNREQSWKQYFLKTVYYIAKLKEYFNYIYVTGNPYSLFHNFLNREKNLLNFGIEKNDNEIVEIALLNKAVPTLENLILAINQDNLEIVKNLTKPKYNFDLNIAMEEALVLNKSKIVDYLTSIGIQPKNALLSAIKRGDIRNIEYLTEHGIFHPDALKFAVGMQIHPYGSAHIYLEIVDYLIENNYKINSEIIKFLRTHPFLGRVYNHIYGKITKSEIIKSFFF